MVTRVYRLFDSKKNSRWIVVSILALILTFLPLNQGETLQNASQTYAKARIKYHQLMKVKPKHRDKWIKVSDQFEAVYNGRNSGSELTAKALFSAANLYFELYKLSYTSIDLKESRKRYNLLVEQYPKHRLADDSLYRLGEISIKEGNKPEAAKSFGLIVTKYPKGDMGSKALIGLRRINYKVPVVSTVSTPHKSYSAPKKKKKSVKKNAVLSIPPKSKTVKPKAKKPTPIAKKKSTSRKEKRLVIIDAGHGGKDPGAVGVNKIQEKRVVLDIALKLKKFLEADKHYKVLMTRSRDKFISLRDRTKIANKNSSAIFVSIHANASKSKNLYGIETFFQGLPKSAAAKETAARENMVFVNKNVPSKDNMLLFVLSDMKNAYLITESSLLAEAIQSNLIKGMQRKYSRIKNLGVKQALFFVLNDAQIPSVLVEVSFLTNRLEGKRLAKSAYRNHIAKSIYKGINVYITQNERVANTN